MPSRTVTSDRELRRILYDRAREQLGPDASDETIRQLADRWYYGPRHRASGTRTPFERLREERVRAAARDATPETKRECT